MGLVHECLKFFSPYLHLYKHFYYVQIEEAKRALKKVMSETDSMEFRNLGLMEVMTAAQMAEAQMTKELISLSTRKGRTNRPMRAGSTSQLPSLVDVSKCTFDAEVSWWKMFVNQVTF